MAVTTPNFPVRSKKKTIVRKVRDIDSKSKRKVKKRRKK